MSQDVNPLHIQWKNPEFFAYLAAQKGVAPGASVLDESNAMEYFATSPFYDRHSNNEHVRMQSAVHFAQAAATAPQSMADLARETARRNEQELR
ncbi:Mediator of RNA polymerase II transcription subunit 6 [Malassezia cuniculi]|uniref:Mediator of RNA polymerase II transcription subunit 6 n=1 Tax=Malassezia cuniculi TaxID=948313 RepID=A0AAF0EVX6_9BASI|nr:Mediator of RNA polymerase II transcription subunit 6 [Malassezia cuniculi]